MATVSCPVLSVRLFAPARVFKDDLYLNRCATRPVLAATGRLDQVRGLSVALLGLALLSGATVQGQSIVGQVTTVAGVPIPGLSVTGTRLFPLQRLSTATDASGNYILGSALGGNYSVVPSKSGYTFTPASSNVLVTAGGADVTADFTTPATVPRAFTQPAQNLTPTSARLLGSVNPDGAATTAWFEYGLTTSYGSASVPANLSSFAADVPVNIAVTGLLNGTNYHFRIVASNIFGLSLGGDLGFATPSGIPAVTTLGPTEGGAMTMTLNASVNPNGGSATGWFEVGTTTDYGFPAAGQNLGNGITPTNFSQALIGLATGTTYHYRAVAATSFGTNYGADTVFT